MKLLGTRRRASEHWTFSRDGDETAMALWHRHYSYRPYADGRQPKLFCGPGEKTVLLSSDELALFVWRKFKCGDGQQGINCAVFRNEGPILSSVLILEAEAVASACWPGERLFTYVNPRAIRSKNPGACFKLAGWKAVGVTKWNRLVILSREGGRP